MTRFRKPLLAGLAVAMAGSCWGATAAMADGPDTGPSSSPSADASPAATPSFSPSSSPSSEAPEAAPQATESSPGMSALAAPSASPSDSGAAAPQVASSVAPEAAPESAAETSAVASALFPDEVSRDGCQVSIPVSQGDEPGKTLQVWDDQQLVEEIEVAGSAGTRQTYSWTITQAWLPGAPGVDIILLDETGDWLGHIEAWDFPEATQVTQNCATSNGESDVIAPQAPPPQQPQPTDRQPSRLPATGF